MVFVAVGCELSLYTVMTSVACCPWHGQQSALFRMSRLEAMNFLHGFDLMRYLLDFPWTWLQCRTVSREYVNAAKSAMLHRVIEVCCAGDCEITSFMLACMINMPWCLPNLKQLPLAVWTIVDALCIRVAPRKASRETGVVLPVVFSNNTRDNICIVICLGTLAEGTGYRKAIDALLDCVEIRDEVVTSTGTATSRCSCLVVMLARILDEDCECEEVAFGLVDMVASGNRYWASVVLEWATTGGCARNVSRFLYLGRIVNHMP